MPTGFVKGKNLFKDRLAYAEKILRARRDLGVNPALLGRYKPEEEGGCGVTGFISSIQVAGRHIFEPSVQMHNRGNGKGGGIAAVGLSAEALGVSEETLKTDYMVQVAFLDPEARAAVEKEYIHPCLRVDKAERLDTVNDYREVDGLEVRPPDVWRYLVRVKADALKSFAEKYELTGLDPRRIEDEFIYRNSYALNQQFYASLGDKKAFVLSHGRNMMILKIVGYAEQVVKYYRLDDFPAHAWIAHQRYPTKGRVWHPGGAHPFIGLDEALVHNGDFANYHSVSEYLSQRGIYQQFLTDTEVSVQLLDLLNRVYGYPLEYIIEAMAPTTEHDFDLLPPEKQRLYRAIQASHIHGSPDGPWFFIIARNNPYEDYLQLIGITDTAMLRPQVFALQEGEVQIGLICSEKQAIDATLANLAAEDPRFSTVADKYWNARGGSYTDGGAFIFTVKGENGAKTLSCTDKFGRPVVIPPQQKPETGALNLTDALPQDLNERKLEELFTAGAPALFKEIVSGIPRWGFPAIQSVLKALEGLAGVDDRRKETVIELLTLLLDRRYDLGDKKRSWTLHFISDTLHRIFLSSPLLVERRVLSRFRLIDWDNRGTLRAPAAGEEILLINGCDFPPEGDECDARLIVAAYQLGWRRLVTFNSRGQRFYGAGLGPDTAGVRIDVYDSSGDYLGSGMDGLEIYVHGNAQDQLGQILKAGKLVIYGDVGQTFMYGAKGGEVYVLGNAAGRPLINAVGRPRVVINGTALDYLAESFMAGDYLNGGGFVILNGLEFDEHGQPRGQATPYPGSNLFSLASGGAIFVRDPDRILDDEQLNGGEYAELTPEDWQLILPYLKENERLFGISLDDHLLTVKGQKKKPEEVYRKVRAVKLAVLTVMEEDDTE